jgi:hypothetical protein
VRAELPTKLDVEHQSVAVGNPTLNLDGTAQGVHHARELHEPAIAGRLDDPASVLGGLGVYEGPAVGLELSECAFFVIAH